ncbi:MAG: diaminopimelate epimerase [Acidothermus sp.]|nr:diaminopimelate epimerase [Acidothermus sp.]MCL6537568.1 diaminopimelate epimerase [Acidothermus sp.]
MDDVAFLKGHATRNDFVVLPDPDGVLGLSEHFVRDLCDRRAGVGADGVLRVVRTTALPSDLAELAGDAAWFMDYRNADGSVAEICGNGVRLFARYLVEAGLQAPGRFVVGTRIGPLTVDVPAVGDVWVWLPAPLVVGLGRVRVDGREFSGTRVSVGNPHLVCAVEDLDHLDLTRLTVEPTDFPEGVNVEFVEFAEPGRLRVRVRERGVGETESCGSGACAVAAAFATDPRRPADGWWRIRLRGGELGVRLDDDQVTLVGPAVIVAEGRVRVDALSEGSAADRRADREGVRE